jgi:hypothetical protein
MIRVIQMKFPLTSRRVFPSIFILLSIGSSAYVIASTVNYLRFFPALDQVQPQISWVSLQKNSLSNQTVIKVHIVVDNPTDYTGIRIFMADVGVYFIRVVAPDNASLFKGSPLVGSSLINSPLGPRGQIASDIAVLLSGDQASSLASFNQSSSGRVIAHTVMTVWLITFLDPVVSRLPRSTEKELFLS